MTRDDIIKLASEAGFEIEETLYGPVPCVDGRGVDYLLERFANLVAAEKVKEIERLREVLNKLEYSFDGAIKRYPDEHEVEVALQQEQPR